MSDRHYDPFGASMCTLPPAKKIKIIGQQEALAIFHHFFQPFDDFLLRPAAGSQLTGHFCQVTMRAAKGAGIEHRDPFCVPALLRCGHSAGIRTG